MPALRVLEYVRYDDGAWNLPSFHVEALAHRFPEVHFDVPADRAEADELLPQADIVLGFAVRPDNFTSACRLQWIHATAAGVGGVLFPDLVDSPVVLTNARGLHARSMAEHTIGIMLAFVRKLHWSRDAQQAARWDATAQERESPVFGTLAGATIGLVGFGHVGRGIAELARGLGMRVIAVRRHPALDPAPADEQWGVERLHDLLAASDWVVLCAPHTSSTRGLIGSAELACMPAHARLVNLGRGALVDEPALVAALRDGRIAGASLDVFAEEPLPKDSPLWGMREVIVTPHVSGFGPRYWERAMEQFAANLRRHICGEPLENVVDKRAGY
ncbi:MAG: D-2-hydroxyacid dehydrogenase [Candidatus Eisenbacteria bacterium]